MAKITDRGMQCAPGDTDVWLYESFARGSGVFVGRVTPKGERLFYYRYTNSSGKRAALPLGAYYPGGSAGGLTVAQARQRAVEHAALYRSGVRDLHEHFAALAQARNAAAEVEAERLEAERLRLAEEARLLAAERARRITLRALFERWASTDLKPHLRADGTRGGRKDGGAFTRAQFERRVFPKLGDRPATEVTRAELLEVLDLATSEGRRRTAAVLLTDLKQMFRFALARELVLRNPLDTVTKREAGGAAVERDRNLTPEELTELAAALPNAGLSMHARLAIELILATGARVGELMGAAWADASKDSAKLQPVADAIDVKLGFVDLDSRTWHIPNTKNQRPHTIHLSEFAVARFRVLAELREPQVAEREIKPCPWVFPNRGGRAPHSVKAIGKQIADRQRPTEAKRTRRAKSARSLVLSGGNWRAHDLRRTAATRMAELGVTNEVIDECLNHINQNRMTRVYVRHRREAEQAQAFDALGSMLSAIFPAPALEPIEKREAKAKAKLARARRASRR